MLQLDGSIAKKLALITIVKMTFQPVGLTFAATVEFATGLDLRRMMPEPLSLINATFKCNLVNVSKVNVEYN